MNCIRRIRRSLAGLQPPADQRRPAQLVGHPEHGRQGRPAGPFTRTAPSVLPHTIQLCIHCQQRPAGFWVRRIGDTVVRRPWCLSCCQDLDRDRYHLIPFGD